MASYNAPPPISETPPKQGMSGCMKALIIVGVLVALGIVAVVGAGFFVAKRIKDNPGVVIKTALGAANPDYEILEYDDKDKTITVRHKRTGRTAVVRLDELKDGRIDIDDQGHSRPPRESSTRIEDLPDFLRYPGAKVNGIRPGPRGISASLETSDSKDRVKQVYVDQLEKAGYSTTVIPIVSMIKAQKGTSTVVITPADHAGGSLITIVFIEQQ